MFKNILLSVFLLSITTSVFSATEQKDTMPSVQCDTIIDKNGLASPVKIISISPSYITYTQCALYSTKTYTIARSQIREIKGEQYLLNKMSKYAQNDTIKPKTEPYIDAELGILTLGGGSGILGVADINIGILLKNNIGLGLSYVAWIQPSQCCATSASGIGVQMRLQSKKRGILKFDLGYVLRAYYGDDGPYSSQYNHEKSSKMFIRLSPTLRFGSFTTGLTWVTTSGQINDTFNPNTQASLSTVSFSVTSLTLAVGFTIPPYRKPKK